MKTTFDPVFTAVQDSDSFLMIVVPQEGEMQPELQQEAEFHDLRWSLVQRVASSRNFKTSPRLRDFLLYVAGCAIRNAPEEATEQQIGMKVFGREPGYNSSEDSIVRSHARLLRQKLASYFEAEGADEPLRIDVPKGHYLLVFSQHDPISSDRSRYTPAAEALPTLVVAAPAIAPPGHPGPPADLVLPIERPRPAARMWLLWCTLLTVVGALACIGFFWRATHANTSVARLWQPFLTGDPPLLIYSNGVFLGDSKTGMRYATREESQNPPVNGHLIDHYTGIGEVMGVYELTRLFDAAHATFILKRSHLVTWDEARQRNLIFIGSPAENLAVQALPSNTEFTLVSTPSASGYRVNHPRPGEQSIYMRPEQPLTRDYAVISLLPSVQNGKKMMLLSGDTTLGTEAAVEFATRPDSVAELLKAATGSDQQIHSFDALLETTIIGGVPLQTRLITIHVH